MRFTLPVAVLAVAAASLSAGAAVPTKVSYQGRLTSSGAPVNETVSLTVKLYDHPTAGALVWQETQSVAVANGLFSVILGNTAPLDESVFTGQLYLAVAVGSDPDMTPRTPLASAPYSIRAMRAIALDTTLDVAGGGTGATTFGQGRLLYGQGSGAVGALAHPGGSGGNILAAGDLPTLPPAWSGVKVDGSGLLLGAGQVVQINGLQVVGARQVAVPDAVDATGVDVTSGLSTQVVTVAEYNALVAKFNDLLSRLRFHGLIEP